jgi:hypothetical protein
MCFSILKMEYHLYLLITLKKMLDLNQYLPVIHVTLFIIINIAKNISLSLFNLGLSIEWRCLHFIFEILMFILIFCNEENEFIIG